MFGNFFAPEFKPDWPLDDPRMVSNHDKLQEWVSWARDTKDLFIDFETNGKDWRAIKPLMLAATDGQMTRVLDWRVPGMHWGEAVKDAMKGRRGTTIAHNIAFEARVCRRSLGFKLGGTYQDPLKMAYAVNELRQEYKNHGALTQKALVHYELGIEPVYAAAVEAWLMANFGSTETGWDKIPGSLLFNYNVEDVETGWKLYQKLKRSVELNQQTELVTYDAQCSDACYRAEERGIAFDVTYASALANEYSAAFKEEQRAVLDALGYSIDVMSNQKMFGLLYGQWGLPMHPDMEKEGQVDDTVLKWMLTQPQVKDHPNRVRFLEGVDKLRELSKMKDTYLLPWLYEWQKEGVIHPNMYMEGARTRRFSSKNPNMQNVPARTELGGRLRACFVNRPGYTTYSMDESQAEYRVFAEYSNEPLLIDGYCKQRDFDIHQMVADMLGIPRKPGKNTNFGVLYGMGKDKMARNLQMTKAQAEAHLERYYALLPGLRAFRTRLSNEVKTHGYVKTRFGGRRHLTSKDVHKALNTLCQMSVGDLMRRALALADPIISEAGGHFLLQVHDELIFELPGTTEDHRHVLERVKAEAMENIPRFKVPFVSDCEAWSPDWLHGRGVTL